MVDGLSEKVRDAAAQLGEFTIDEVATKIPITNYAEKRSVRAVLKNFENNGEVTKLRKDLYRYRGRRPTLSKTAKIWRAIWIKKSFTRRDLVKLSGASDAHVKSYVTFLKKNGFVQHVTGKGFNLGIYCLADMDASSFDHPQMPRRRRKR